jgi:hypothetical protein
VDYIDEDYASRIGPVREVWDPVEDVMFKKMEELKNGLGNQTKVQNDHTRWLVTEFSNTNALDVLEKADVVD